MMKTRSEGFVSNRNTGWIPDQKREEHLNRLGFQEGMHILKAEKDKAVIGSLADFKLSEFRNDPRTHPNPVIAGAYKAQIVRYSLGFHNIDSMLHPSSQMLSFFEGFELAARVLCLDRMKEQQKKWDTTRRKKKAKGTSRKATRNPVKRSKRK